MNGRWSIALQHVYPRRLLSRAVLHATRVRARPARPFQQWLIRTVVRRYRVDLTEAVTTEAGGWPTFNAFFTRALRPGARPLPEEPDAIASPADATVLEAGAIDGATLVQAKSLTFSLDALLGEDGSAAAAAALAGGTYATLYLSPRDYHRVHLPADGALAAIVHLPGDRFGVSPAAASRIRRLFARNERVVLHFRDPEGRPFAVVMVGALLVGSIETPWTGAVAELPGPGNGPVRRWEWDGPRLPRGAEIGRFNMGSTVIALFPPGMARWDPACRPGASVRCRQRIGVRLSAPPPEQGAALSSASSG